MDNLIAQQPQKMKTQRCLYPSGQRRRLVSGSATSEKDAKCSYKTEVDSLLAAATDDMVNQEGRWIDWPKKQQ